MSDLRSAPIPPLQSDDHVRGESGLALAIIYADFSCPHCALARRRLAGAPIRLVFRHFVLKSRPRAAQLAAAAEAAACQGAFWEFHDALFGDPAHTEDPDLWRHVRGLGLDLDRFQTDRRCAQTLQRVQRDLHSGLRGGVASTPTLFIDGVAHPGPPSPELLSTLTQTPVR